MYLVLSPAKRLHEVSVPKDGTNPVFWKESRALAQCVQELTTTDLESLMKISSKLSTLNHVRFQVFEMCVRALEMSICMFVFSGCDFVIELNIVTW